VEADAAEDQAHAVTAEINHAAIVVDQVAVIAQIKAVATVANNLKR